MPRTAAQQRGCDFEERLAGVLGGRPQPRSGGLWFARSDVAGKGLLTSAKAVSKRTWKQTKVELEEAIECALGTGDAPLLAILDEDDEEYVVMRLSDFSGVLTAVKAGELSLEPSRAQRQRHTASVPIMLRDRA